MDTDIHGNPMDRDGHGNRPRDGHGNPWDGGSLPPTPEPDPLPTPSPLPDPEPPPPGDESSDSKEKSKKEKNYKGKSDSDVTAPKISTTRRWVHLLIGIGLFVLGSQRAESIAEIVDGATVYDENFIKLCYGIGGFLVFSALFPTFYMFIINLALLVVFVGGIALIFSPAFEADEFSLSAIAFGDVIFGVVVMVVGFFVLRMLGLSHESFS